MEKFHCICCEKEIECTWFDCLEVDNPEQGSWNGGVVEKLYMPYGSKFDTDTYVFGICDECVEEKYKKGLIGKKLEKGNEN